MEKKDSDPALKIDRTKHKKLINPILTDNY